MRHSFYDNPSYRNKQAAIARKYYALHPRTKTLITRICKYTKCRLPFQVTKPSDQKIYCSHSCSAIVSNPKRKQVHYCFTCRKEIKRSAYKYCSSYCQWNNYYKQYITRWRQGLENGNIGITARALSAYLKYYLKEKYGDKCSRCGWSQKHPKTLVVPLEVNHIDGNAENNKEENLEFICPNCHALTPNFRNLNKGNGRNWRLKLK